MNNQLTQQLRYNRQTLNFAKKFTFLSIDKNNFIKERLLYVQRTQSSLKNYTKNQQLYKRCNRMTNRKTPNTRPSYKELVKVATTESS